MSGARQTEDPAVRTAERPRGGRRWRVAVAALAVLAAGCGGDDGVSDEGADATPAVEDDTTTSVEAGAEEAASTQPVEALRVDFETVQDDGFRLFELDGELWLVDSEFGALQIDPSVPVSSCETTLCMTGSMDFGSTFVEVDEKAFTVETEFSPNYLAWIGADFDGGPAIVQDERIAPGDLRGRYGERIAVSGDWVAAYDDSDLTIESVDATSVTASEEAVIAAPIAVDPVHSGSTTGLISDGETVWLLSGSGPYFVAHVDLAAGTVGTAIEVANEWGFSQRAVVAGGYVVVDATDVDEDTGDVAEQKLTAYAPDGEVVELPEPSSPLRSLVAAGDRALVVLEDEAQTTYVVDPGTGEVSEPIDLGLEGEYTVTAYTGGDAGDGTHWLEARGNDLPRLMLRVDLAEAEIVERIELTEELEDGIGPRFVDGHPYFFLGDGESERWQLVILGEPGAYGEPSQPSESVDDSTGGDSTRDDGTHDDDEPATGDDDEPSDEEAPTEEPDDEAPADDEDECEEGQSLMECYG